jgi:hypothetical protein
LPISTPKTSIANIQKENEPTNSTTTIKPTEKPEKVTYF